MDDDTELPDNYYTDLASCLDRHPGFDVYVPLVATRKSGELLSPSILKNYYTYRIKSPEEIGRRPYSAINSGLLVRRDLYHNYRYDERLFLDCIDHDFIVYCRKHRYNIYLMKEICLTQNFSGDEKASRRSKLKRYQIFSRDFRYFRKKNSCPMLKTELLLIKRKIGILSGL